MTIIEEDYTQCPYCHAETPNSRIRETDGRCRWCPVADVSVPAGGATCKHGKVVSPAICRQHHED